MREHLESEVRENLDRSMPEREARRRAAIRFGNMAKMGEETRAVWTVVWLEQFLQDVRYGCRSFLKSPAFLLVSVITIGLGVGATATVFSVVHGVLIRPLSSKIPAGWFESAPNS